jgi:hypothetical protein
MAGSKTGTSTIYHLAKKICKMVAVYGATDLAARTSTEFAAAVAALVLACHAFDALDNFPFQIDRVAPAGVEDAGH